MWNRFVTLLSEVCATPDPPRARTGASVFRAAPAYLRYRLTLWLLRRLAVLAPIVASAIVFETEARSALGVSDFVAAIVHVVEGSAALAWLASMPVGYALVRLDYEQRWYVVTDRSLFIREGVTLVREMTLTFANVQNVTVEQGPLQRIFAVADLRVQTAGGGGTEAPGQPSMHTGFLRGLDDAATLRTLIMARLRLGADAGLGDPDDTSTPAIDAALGDLLSQARALGASARRIIADAHDAAALPPA